jgi:hypothetical protein
LPNKEVVCDTGKDYSNLSSKIMSLYDFRLRFNFSEVYRIDSDVEQLELLVLPHGEHIRLNSGAIGTPIKDHACAAIIGGPYASEHQARTAAEKSKRALIYWAIEQRLGIDFGDGKQKSVVTNEGLAMLQNNHGCTLRNDTHGIDVYGHDEKLRFVQFHAKATLGKNPPRLKDTFQREYLNSRQLTEKQVLACEIYTSSFFDVSPRTRFITLVTTIEALLEPLKRSDAVQALVTRLIATTKQQSTIDEPTKESIISSLGKVQYQSIGQAGRTLACRLLPNQSYNGQSSADFFTRCYNYRSQILHNGTIPEKSVDILQLANDTESFVHQLLIAVLNSKPQQDTVAEAGTES